MIEWEYTEGRNDVPIRVRLDGKIVGEIRPITGGWQYFPKGHKDGGEIFKTVGQVQVSLRGEG